MGHLSGLAKLTGQVTQANMQFPTIMGGRFRSQFALAVRLTSYPLSVIGCACPYRPLQPQGEPGLPKGPLLANVPVCGRAISRQVLRIQLPRAAAAEYNLGKFT
jgi:hypothetical protein